VGRRALHGAVGLADRPRVGGILNATFGNIAELIIAFFALQAGLIEVVKASLTGSIIGNLLLVLGASILVGGLRHGIQTFSARVASSNASLLVLAVIGLFVPAVFAFTTNPEQGTLTEESVLIAFALIAGYVLSLVYQFTNPDETLGGHGESAGHGGPAWTVRVAVIV
jgi:Ca2+:H+ antiporter